VPPTSEPDGFSYVVPLRCDAICPPGAHAAFSAYLAAVGRHGEVIVVDGSPLDVIAVHRGAFGHVARHMRVDAALHQANGKVAGVRTGLRASRHELVVLADEDVRYDDDGLRAVLDRLADADLVIPQNVFARPMPWHATWDTARSLINRSVGHDYPGTLGVRRGALPTGYDGDVLFENLELIRTIRAAGGRVIDAPDVFVTRLAPTTATFLAQRVRQAYDDLAQPARLVASLLVVPGVAVAARRRRWGGLGAAAAMAVGVAELGRRRGHGVRAFPASASLLAPAWVLERGVCSWLAVGSRVLRGGIRYRGVTIRRAATPARRLRARAAA